MLTQEIKAIKILLIFPECKVLTRLNPLEIEENTAHTGAHSSHQEEPWKMRVSTSQLHLSFHLLSTLESVNWQSEATKQKEERKEQRRKKRPFLILDKFFLTNFLP